MKFKFQNFQHTYISGAMAWELRFKWDGLVFEGSLKATDVLKLLALF